MITIRNRVFIFMCRTELNTQHSTVSQHQLMLSNEKCQAQAQDQDQDQDWERTGGGGGAGLLAAVPGRPGGGVRQAALQAQHQVVAEAAADDVVQEHRGQVGDPFVQLKHQ